MGAYEARDVRELFNGKAGSWLEKYRPSGGLSFRLESFVTRASELCGPSGKVLDLGCGTGNIAAALAGLGYQVVGCDIAERMIGIARSHWAGAPVEWVCLAPGWAGLPLADNSFDCVVAASLFEYLEDPGSAAKEISRILLPGGTLLFSVPNPFAKVRRAEAWLRRILTANGLLLPIQRTGRIAEYACYLRLSRNRPAGERWKALLEQNGLRPVDDREFAAETWRAGPSLILLAARKAAA